MEGLECPGSEANGRPMVGVVSDGGAFTPVLCRLVVEERRRDRAVGGLVGGYETMLHGGRTPSGPRVLEGVGGCRYARCEPLPALHRSVERERRQSVLSGSRVPYAAGGRGGGRGGGGEGSSRRARAPLPRVKSASERVREVDGVGRDPTGRLRARTACFAASHAWVGCPL